MGDYETKPLDGREIVLDVETTGLEHDGEQPDRIIEIGAVELINGTPKREFHKFVNPNVRDISDTITKITGSTNEKLKESPNFEDPSIVDQLLDFIGDATIVAHNASFDRSFLNAELKRAKKKTISEDRWIDTMDIAREKYPLVRRSLDKLCDHFKISRKDRRQRHGALIDARLLVKVYLALHNKLEEEFGFETRKEEMVHREIVLDVSTTGLEHDGENPDRIIELGAVELINGTPKREFHKFVNPDVKEISNEVTKINGLTNEKLMERPNFEDPSIVEELLEFIGDSAIVAHNASFDRSFLNAELTRARKDPIPDHRWKDTMDIARKKVPLVKPSLDKLCDHYKISRADRRQHHGGLIDARLLVKVYQGLNDCLAEELGLEAEKDEVVSVNAEFNETRTQPIRTLLTESEQSAHRNFLLDTFKNNSIWGNYEIA